MARVFTAPLQIADAGTDVDQSLFELVAGAGDKIVLYGFELTSSATTATAMELVLKRISGAGTGGTAVTEEDVDQNTDLTATAALQTDVETPGTAVATLKTWQWEQLGPLVYMPIPEARLVSEVSQGFSLNVTASPANAALGGYIIWEEV